MKTYESFFCSNGKVFAGRRVMPGKEALEVRDILMQPNVLLRKGEQK